MNPQHKFSPSLKFHKILLPADPAVGVPVVPEAAESRAMWDRHITPLPFACYRRWHIPAMLVWYLDKSGRFPNRHNPTTSSAQTAERRFPGLHRGSFPPWEVPQANLSFISFPFVNPFVWRPRCPLFLICMGRDYRSPPWKLSSMRLFLTSPGRKWGLEDHTESQQTLGRRAWKTLKVTERFIWSEESSNVIIFTFLTLVWK